MKKPKQFVIPEEIESPSPIYAEHKCNPKRTSYVRMGISVDQRLLIGKCPFCGLNVVKENK